MSLFKSENVYNTAIKTEAFTSVPDLGTCSDVIPTYSILVKRKNYNLSPGAKIPSSHKRSNHRHTIIINSAEEIKESGRSFQFLIVRGKKPFI